MLGHPLWQLGARPFAILGDGRIAVLHGRGDMRLGVLDPDSGELTDLETSYPTVAAAMSGDETGIAMVAGASDKFDSVILMDGATHRLAELHDGTEGLPNAAYLPVPRQAELAG